MPKRFVILRHSRPIEPYCAIIGIETVIVEARFPRCLVGLTGKYIGDARQPVRQFAWIPAQYITLSRFVRDTKTTGNRRSGLSRNSITRMPSSSAMLTNFVFTGKPLSRAPNLLISSFTIRGRDVGARTGVMPSSSSPAATVIENRVAVVSRKSNTQSVRHVRGTARRPSGCWYRVAMMLSLSPSTRRRALSSMDLSGLLHSALANGQPTCFTRGRAGLLNSQWFSASRTASILGGASS